jgi:hypothetical protein
MNQQKITNHKSPITNYFTFTVITCAPVTT